jgi:hypothetical protein
MFSGTKPSLYWKTTGLDNLEFTRISNIQTVFHISQLVETGPNQSCLLGDTTFFDYTAGEDGTPNTWFSNRPPTQIRDGSNFINGISRDFETTSRDLNRNLITMVHTSAIGRSNQISIDRGNPRSWRGYIQEITVYTSSLLASRELIEYNINNYYNIYPQTSSFATSSFTIKADSGSISGSLNNRLTSGIAASGPLGLITVSRTGSNSLTIARNGASTSFTVPASGALSTGLYLGAINNNGIAVGNSPVNISFASVGTGLNEIETLNLNRLVYNLQSNFKEDTDATAFITAAQLTNPTIVSAVRSLVLNLKGYGLWDKLKAIYPIVSDGISQTRASQHKWNLKDPRDLDAAYRLAFQPSGWTHSSTGALPNGGTYANTFFAPNLLPLNSAHMSYYSRTDTTSTSVDMGVGQTGFGDFLLAPRYNTGLYDISRINSGYPGGGTATVSQGLFTVSRVSSTGFKTYKNSSILTDRPSATSTTAATLPIWIGALNLNGGISDRTTREVAFATIGEGLTDFEAANLYTVVQTFQTTLGRQV